MVALSMENCIVWKALVVPSNEKIIIGKETVGILNDLDATVGNEWLPLIIEEMLTVSSCEWAQYETKTMARSELPTMNVSSSL